MRNGFERAWWTEVESDAEEADLAWLRETVYGGCGITCPRAGPRRRVTASDRWREDPADLAGEKPVYPGAPEPVAV